MADAPASDPSSLPDAISEKLTSQIPQWVWVARIRRPQGRKGEVFADILTDFPEKFADRRRLWLIVEKGEEKSSPSNSAARSVEGTGFSGKGTGFSGKGTGFSPYINSPQKSGALAPEGTLRKIPPTAQLPREIELKNHWLHKGGIVLHFSGIDSISDAETLASLIVAIPRAERAPLADDEIYIADLIGCTLIDVTGPTPIPVGTIEEVDRTAGPVALLVVQAQDAAEEILVPFAKSYLRKIDLAARRVEMALPAGLIDLNAGEKS